VTKIGKILFALAVFLFITMLVIYPAKFIAVSREAIRLCLDVIIPSLFPFLVAVGILVRLGLPRYMSRNLSPLMRPLFNIPGSGALALIMGLISGYPLGAKIARELYESGDCTKYEAERMLAFCNNSGPLFIVGAVGAGMLFSPGIGHILYISHVLSAILVGMLFKFYRRGGEPLLLPTNSITVRKKLDSGIVGSIGDAIQSALFSMAKICGFVVLFAAIVAALPNFGGDIANASVAGIFEITEGILRFAAISSMPQSLKLAIISFVLSFSGFSVMAQVAAIVKPIGLSMKPYVIGKLLAGLISAGITYVVCMILSMNLELSAQVFAPRYEFRYLIPMLLPAELFFRSLTAIAWCVAGIVVTVVIVRVFFRNEKQA